VNPANTRIAAGYDQSRLVASPPTSASFTIPWTIRNALAGTLTSIALRVVCRSRFATKSVGSSLSSPSTKKKTTRLIATGERKTSKSPPTSSNPPSTPLISIPSSKESVKDPSHHDIQQLAFAATRRICADQGCRSKTTADCSFSSGSALSLS